MSGGRVVVVGLGPAGADLVTARATDAVAAVPTRFARTDHHPAVAVLGEHRSFDEVYEAAATLAQVYPAIVERLVAAAGEAGEVLYAVPGSPLVAERTVELLRADGRVEVRIEPALSFLDLAWARLGVDPLSSGARLVDGHRFAVEAAGERGPLLVAQCDSVDVLSDVKLAVDGHPRAPVLVLQRLGLHDEAVHEVAWEDLDRVVEPDHLTTLWVPELAAPVGAELVRFAEVVSALRQRCPWDREQTHASLRRYLVEEAYEVLDTIDRLDEESGEGYEELEEELGDLLFQVYLHATIASESGAFTLADVARGIHDKLVHRHPHVFGGPAPGEAPVADADSVVADWERAKAAEKAAAGAGPFDSVPRSLPALAYASTLQRKAAAVSSAAAGPTAPPGGDEATEVGAALFDLVARARAAGVDAEQALRDVANRFRAEVEAAMAHR
ncbi:MAG: nucleotide pyrophosphohydrolase [Acidimicrobiia bacterium]|nr:nucleotide pyrophosphohydrolase [Acidimicrobiia bacterium]